MDRDARGKVTVNDEVFEVVVDVGGKLTVDDADVKLTVDDADVKLTVDDEDVEVAVDVDRKVTMDD